MKTKDNAKFHIVLVKGWLKKENKFLLAKRADSEGHAAGWWSLPGGKIDDLDNTEYVLQKTLAEEFIEEVGVEIEEEIELVYNNSFVRSDGTHVVGLTFLCHWKSGEAKPLEDTAEVKWMTLDELNNFEDKQEFLVREIRHLEKYLAS